MLLITLAAIPLLLLIRKGSRRTVSRTEVPELAH